MTEFGKIIEPRRVKIEAPRKKDLSNEERKQMLNILLSGSILLSVITIFNTELGKVHAFSLCAIMLSAYLLMKNNNWR